MSILVAPLVPIPIAFVISKHGIGLGAVVGTVIVLVAMLLAVVAAGSGQVLFGVSAGLIIILLIGPVGMGAGISLRRGVSQLRLFLLLTGIFFMSLSIWLGALVAASGFGPQAGAQTVAEYMIESSRPFYLALGMSEQDIDSRKTEVLDMAAMAPYMAPAVVLVASAALSGVSVGLARKLFAKMRQPFPQDFVLRDFRLHFSFAYMMILGLLCELVAPFLPEAYSSPASLAGANLLIVAEVLFFIQGVAIASFFLWRYKVSKPKRAGIYAVLVLLQLTLSLVSWIGLFDTWIDYRRRFAKQRA